MEHLALENACLRILVDRETGATRQVEHRGAGLSLIADSDRAAAHPFMVILADGTILREWLACTVKSESRTRIRIHWTLAQGLRLEVGLDLD
ncbi:MAG TPA: hypothetical protein VNL35_20710, partial [Chloroflexota bacterium]|nr:hypothetical protein [Chloroflexota bacterium]